MYHRHAGDHEAEARADAIRRILFNRISDEVA
jgi:hypothetical protein